VTVFPRAGFRDGFGRGEQLISKEDFMLRPSSTLSLFLLTALAACGGSVGPSHDNPPPGEDAGPDVVTPLPPYGGYPPGYGSYPPGYGYGYGYSPGYGYGYGYGGYGYGYGYGYPPPPDCGYGYGPYGYAYGWGCSVPGDTVPQHHIEPIPTTGDLSVTVVWQNAAGLPAPADLTVTADGNGAPLLQIFSNGSQAFARAGMQVTAIQPNVPYQVAISQSGDVVLAVLERSSQVLLSATEQVSSPAPFADFITPGLYYRQDVTLYWGI
jgi:hypothetical protein